MAGNRIDRLIVAHTLIIVRLMARTNKRTQIRARLLTQIRVLRTPHRRIFAH